VAFQGRSDGATRRVHVSPAALLDGGDVDLFIGIIASKARFASPPTGRKRLG